MGEGGKTSSGINAIMMFAPKTSPQTSCPTVRHACRGRWRRPAELPALQLPGFKSAQQGLKVQVFVELPDQAENVVGRRRLEAYALARRGVMRRAR